MKIGVHGVGRRDSFPGDERSARPAGAGASPGDGWPVSLMAGCQAAACATVLPASGRGTSRGCGGGVRLPSAAARKVGQGALPGSAQSPARRKKQSSQVAWERFNGVVQSVRVP